MEKLLSAIESEPASILTFHSQPESHTFHTHSKYQLTYLEGGASHLYTAERVYFIPTNHFVWIPAKISHRFEHPTIKNVWVRSLYIPPQYVPHLEANEIGIYFAPPLLREVLRFCGSNSYDSSTPEIGLLNATLHLLPKLFSQPLPLELPLSAHALIQQVTTYTVENIQEPLTISSVARTFNLGTKTFSRLFLKETGVSYHQYIKNTRIMRSVELILEKKLTLSEIAYEVGYGSLSAYSNAFVSVLQKRPGEFKV